MFSLLKERNFRLFWLGQLISVIGDHISLIAFPWLVLQISGSAGLTGLAFGVQAIPRAIFILFGGVLVDRFSPRLVMLTTNLVRALLVACLAYLLFLDMVNLPLVFAFALAFGLADAFFYPAEQAVLPSLVSEENLQKGNALNQMLLQLGIIIGPILAGLIIAGGVLAPGHAPSAAIGGGYAEARPALAAAFAVDAGTFFISWLSLLFVRARNLSGTQESESFTRQIRTALKFVWRRPAIRLAFLGIACLEFLFQAPVYVGLPVLADLRYTSGAGAYGLWVSAYGVGSLAGGLIAGQGRTLDPRAMVRVMFLFFGWSAATMGLILLFDIIWWGAFLFATAGITDGYVWVQFISWLQRLTPEDMLGRVMSILILLSVGLLPIAYMVIGALLEISVTGVLAAVSILLVAISVAVALHPDGRRLEALDTNEGKI